MICSLLEFFHLLLIIMLFGNVDQCRFLKIWYEMDATHQLDCAKAIPQVLYHWEIAGEGMTGNSGDNGVGTVATTSYNSRIAWSFHLLLTAKMGGRPTESNADGTSSIRTGMEAYGELWGAYL